MILHNTRWLWTIPVLLALLINQNVLQNGLGWDDESIIRGIQPPERWLDLFLPHLSDASFTREDSPYFRPIIYISYALDYQLWGRTPFGFHLSLWIAHILNTLLVFSLARELVGDSGQVRGPAQTNAMFPASRSLRLTPHIFLPFIAASLFAVHPVHAEAIAWIAGRSDVYCTTFLLISFLLYIKYIQTGQWWIFGSSMLVFFLALLSKETAVGMILLFILYDFLFTPADFPGKRRRILLRSIPPVLMVVAYFWLRTVNIQYPYGELPYAGVLSHSDEPAVWRVINAYGYYLLRMIFPYPQAPFVTSLPATAAFFLSACLAVVITSVGILYTVIYRQILPAIGLAWTVVLLAPAVAVAVLEITVTPVAERYLYAPSAGFLIAAAWLILQALEWVLTTTNGPRWKVWAPAGLIFAGILIFWGWESAHRNAIWQNPMTFWKAAAAVSKESGYPHRALGVQYALLGRNAAAEEHYLQAAMIDEKVFGPDHVEVALTLNNLVDLYYSQEKYAEAERNALRSLAILEKALGKDHPNLAMNLYNLGVLYRRMGQYTKAEQFLQRSLEIEERTFGSNHPATAVTMENLALALENLGKYAEADRFYQRVISIVERTRESDNQRMAASLGSYAGLLRKMKRDTEAEKIEARAAAIREKLSQENR